MESKAATGAAEEGDMNQTRQDEERDTRVRHCAEAENDDPREDRINQVASRASQAMRHGGRDDSGAKLVPCQMSGCVRMATPRPVRDASPERRVIGQVAICDQCQARTDTINAKVAR